MKYLSIIILCVALTFSVYGCGGGGGNGGGCASSANNFDTSEISVTYTTDSGYSDAPRATDKDGDRVNFSCVPNCNSGGSGGSGVSVQITCLGAGGYYRYLSCDAGQIIAIVGSVAAGCAAGYITCSSDGENQTDSCDTLIE